MRLRISARSSDLAKIQAYRVGEALRNKNPNIEIEFLFRESLGDKNLTDPLWKMPEKGVFTEDFLKDLLDEQTDLVVHSWKDLPTEEKEQTVIAATLPRADQRDLLLFKKSSVGNSNPRLLSSSPRRVYNLDSFLKSSLPWEVEKVHFENVRGNVPTRLRKLFENPEADGLILAKAALDRLMTAPESEFKDVQNTLLEKMQFLNWQVLPLSVNPTAAAQGALAVECKKSRQDLISMLSEINSEHDRLNVEEERKVLKYHGGGCHQKIGTSIQRRNILGRHVEIHFLRGLTDQGKVLRQSEFTFEENDQRPSGFVEEQILDSRELWENVQREEIPFDALQVTEAEALLVTKTDALSPDFLKYNLSKTQQFGKTQILWTSGVKTWFDLSKQGCWVNGTLDSMGEDDLPKIYPWMGDVSSWTKVTHAGSPEFENIISVPTYRVHREIKNINLAKIKIIFWRSGTEYIEAVASFPELQDKEAACGFGNSYKTLLHAGVSPEKLHLYLSADEWRRKCLS